ncbi:MAG: hypothetical protein QM674_21005 [Burkholderiaceae bacterium]
MIIAIRYLIILAALSAVSYAVLYVCKGQPRYLRWSLRILTGSLIGALVFFIGLFIERLTA